MSRRWWIAPLLVAFGLAAAGDEPSKPKPRDPVKVTDEALRIQREALVIDGHNDLPWALRKQKEGTFTKVDLNQPQPKLHTDIPRLRKGGVGAQFWSAWVPCDITRGSEAVQTTLEQIDVIYRLASTYPDTFELAFSVDDILRIRQRDKIASLIGLEGGHSINNSLAVLRMLHQLGARYMTLTHSETLDWADSATDKPKSNGLSPFGEQVVREMNRLGMMVDISHVSADTMRHALRVTKAPVIASHSSAFALANHPRNVPDDVLKLVKQNNGVVMINFFPGFIVPEAARVMKDMFAQVRELKAKYPKEEDFQGALEVWKKEHPIPTGSVHTVVDHIEHVIKVAGIDHVGLGSDFDGITAVPQQLEDVSCYPNITQELLNRGYSKEDILKVLGGNLLRVFREVERVARNWQ
jgi:membrane dipeptidase